MRQIIFLRHDIVQSAMACEDADLLDFISKLFAIIR